MLPTGAAPERLTPTDGQAPWSLTTSSISGGACSGLDSFAGLYIRTAKIVQGIPVVTYPPTIDWSIEFIIIGSIPRSRFI
jgi:hypothetical protein